MSLADERQVRSRLSAALDEFSPGPLPLDAVVRQGRMVRLRRRLAVIAGVVVLAAAAAAGPEIVHQFGQQAPAAPAHYHVTVRPPGQRSQQGLIASGAISGRPWQVTVTQQGTNRNRNLCFTAQETSTCLPGGPSAPARSGDPADPVTTIGLRPIAIIGSVRSGVTAVRVSLSNGQILTLRPVPVFGRSYTAYYAVVVPFSSAITEIAAYAGAREVGFTVPFTAGGTFSATRWFKPGQHPSLSTARYLIGSGSAGGSSWTYYAYVGAWGTCLRGGSGGLCETGGLGELGDGKAASLLMLSNSSQHVYEGLMKVSQQVGYLVIRTPHGTAVAVFARRPHTLARLLAGATRPVSYLGTNIADGFRFVSFASLPGNRAHRWAAYADDGRELASGSVPSWATG